MGETLSHHQDERTISAYLTYFNPEKYTFYKSSFYKAFCDIIGVKPAKKNQKYGHYLEMLNDFISEYIVSDTELIEMVKKFLPAYYDGTNHLLLAQDILYNSFDGKEEMEELVIDEKSKYWLYAPGEKAVKWNDFYDNGIMALGWDQLGDLNQYKKKEDIADELRFHDASTGSKKNDTHANYEFLHTMSIGDVVFVKKGRQEFIGYGIVTSDYYYDEGRKDYKSCRKVKWISKGLWKDDDNSTVLKTLTNISQYKDYVIHLKELFGLVKKSSPLIKTNTNMSLNQILYGPPGTGKTYRLKNEYFPKYTSSEISISPEKNFENVVKECSWWQVIAIALLELGRSKVSDIHNNRWIAKKAELSNSKTIRPTLWGQLQSHTIDECEYVNVSKRQNPQFFIKTEDSSWEIIPELVEELAPELNDIIDSVNNFNPSSNKEIKRYVFTTFHQSFSYEDFIEGIKPVMLDEGVDELTYQIEPGVFKKLCADALNDPENQYAIFIDEINRGNLSSIFGELITLIEDDKRKGAANEMSAELPYSKTLFSVPSNVDIYGTMNTADRSVEALDTALRRRFSFVEMLPDPKLLKQSINGVSLSGLLSVINERIEVLVDRDHTIGHAFFINNQSLDDLRSTFADKVIPLLQEYFYGDYAKMEWVIGSAFFKEPVDVSKVKFAVKNHDFDLEGKVYHIKDVNDKSNFSDAAFIAALENCISVSS
jgi:5-methylcytosine-specific restriction protein B